MDSYQLDNTMAHSLAITIVLGIAFHCQSDIRNLVSARNVFLITLLMWFVLEACLLPEAVQYYTQSQYELALVSVFLSFSCFLTGYTVFRIHVFRGFFDRLRHADNPYFIWMIFLLACLIGFLPLLVIAQGDITLILQDAFTPRRRWSGIFQRGRYGGLRDAFLELQMFLKAALPIAAAICVQRVQPQSRKLVAGSFLIYMFARAFNSGTRSNVVLVLLPIMAAIYWRLDKTWKKYALMIGLPALIGLGLYWSAATVIGRNEGRVAWNEAHEAQYVGFEMFRELLFLQSMVPEYYPFQYGHTYYVQAVNPIPRFIWKEKPSGDAGLMLARMQGAYSNGRAHLTISPGLIGEMYWNFGFAGIGIISMLLGLICRSWDLASEQAKYSVLTFTVFSAGFGIIFVSGRSINMATLYGMIALFSVLTISQKR